MTYFLLVCEIFMVLVQVWETCSKQLAILYSFYPSPFFSLGGGEGGLHQVILEKFPLVAVFFSIICYNINITNYLAMKNTILDCSSSFSHHFSSVLVWQKKFIKCGVGVGGWCRVWVCLSECSVCENPGRKCFRSGHTQLIVK